ncbi:c-type cytochrome [Candidatus Palauibacter sp.]|uniref:c-type cytochrome n=1 Tax=Candidatus Palauibacter sp. TaxID=3101350 RepID=UPI003B015DB8
MKRLLAHPFWQGAIVIVASYVVFEYVIGYVLPVIGVASAPVPGSVILQYMLTVLVGIVLYMSADEGRWRSFREPIRATMVARDRKTLRGVLMVALPVIVGWLAYQNVRPSYAAPATLRSVHPAPPNQLTFRGESIELTGLENPLHAEGSLEEHLQVGKAIYVRNCVPCHGDLLDGQGHYAPAFNPVPADFTSSGNLPQLTESYVFWRIVKGGPGLPREGTPWDSAMPAWETILEQDEIWAVILYLYDQTGFTPRTWEEEGEEGHE